MDNQHSGLQQLIGSIYEAAMNPAEWRGILECIRQHVRAKHAVINFHDALCRHRNLVITAGAKPEEEQCYLDAFIDLDVRWFRRAFMGQPEGVAVASQDFEQLTGIDRFNLYGEHNEFFKAVDCYHQVFAPLILTATTTSALSVHRSEQEQPFSRAEVDFISLLAPHVLRSMRLYEHMLHMRRAHNALLQCIQHIPCGVVILNREQTVSYSNRTAAAILQDHPAISLGKNGKLVMNSSTCQARLPHLIAEVEASIRAGKPPITQHLALAHAQRTHALKLTITALPHRASDAELNLAVYISDPARRMALCFEYLALQYGFTLAEYAVAEQLLNGACTTEIAQLRHTKEDTIRVQIKSMLHKTHTANQAALVRLLTVLGEAI